MLVSRRPMPGSFAEVNLKEPEQAVIVEPCFVNESAFGWLWFQATLAAVSAIWPIFHPRERVAFLRLANWNRPPIFS